MDPVKVVWQRQKVELDMQKVTEIDYGEGERGRELEMRDREAETEE